MRHYPAEGPHDAWLVLAEADRACVALLSGWGEKVGGNGFRNADGELGRASPVALRYYLTD